ncbi:Hypothetical protein A7982_03921 [Minicystis rosea]|nr:Hypothetical protein A7982_03921 [Minicystis rosea]
MEGRLDGGLEGLFQIDTGVAEPMVTSKYLELSLAVHPRWYVGPVRPQSFFGAGGIKAGAARPIEGSRFCARGEGACLDLPRILAWAALASVIQGPNDIEHAGVFGGSAFRGRVLELDYPALRVRVRPSM